MDSDQDLDGLLDQHQALRKAMPSAWNAFFVSLRKSPASAVAGYASHFDGTKCTRHGTHGWRKTEAVLAPVCERLARHRWPGLSVLVITPTRALVNDLYTRLHRPFDQMRIRLGRKTGDHGLPDEIQDQVILTTPESVESLLTFRRAILEQVQVVVVDEIHLLDGSPRGDQLRTLLSRLSVFRHHVGGIGFAGLQSIAMSATVSDPRRLANVYLGIDLGDRSSCRTAGIGGPNHACRWQRQAKSRASYDCSRSICGCSQILVFVNSRKQVDAAAGYYRFGRFTHCPVYGHHGSLAKAQREETEIRFKSGYRSDMRCDHDPRNRDRHRRH